MNNFLLQIFTWWNGQTLGTRFFTWRFGKFVGKDEFGNIYYEDGKKTSYGLSRRWVVYNGYAEASSIPPMWHGWIHHRRDDISLEQGDNKENIFSWQKPHRVNGTGSPDSYYPRNKKKGVSGDSIRFTGEYKAWSPDS
ncbi:NADH:ubiquinone oxidoreductase subunit NDUFA12 [Candidatus Liberibacter sp.]|uniref:NADH:ubiquinone oxidoreductase subunit NDUFA12 n=1 Tax=Candidatus Liberibacter sp. TaxID=34022 RepID=UPI0015F36BB4|nr:NADH:ubiquinone oxidoreductase subunit NDUFA12 [Candidatus Liberibacter sp.]MBA5724085.1 NADH:ubiquinone oxidoreductase subunit NDUFA12 [Candidatus Liberibacter sp.]